jgi:hypothetical protein
MKNKNIPAYEQKYTSEEYIFTENIISLNFALWNKY